MQLAEKEQEQVNLAITTQEGHSTSALYSAAIVDC